MNIIQFTVMADLKAMNYIVLIVSIISIIISALNYVLNPGIIYSNTNTNEIF